MDKLILQPCESTVFFNLNDNSGYQQVDAESQGHYKPDLHLTIACVAFRICCLTCRMPKDVSRKHQHKFCAMSKTSIYLASVPKM